MSGARVGAGSPEPLGARLDAEGANFAVFSGHATAIDICLFDGAGEVETARIALPERTGDVFHGHIAGVARGARYGLRAHGPYAPREGHRFNANKLLVDPYADMLDRQFRLHASMFGYRVGDPDGDLSFDATDSAACMPKAIITAPEAAEPAREITPWAGTIIYELHVRGFTMRHPDIPPDLRGTFAGLAHPAAIAHLTGLGVTAVEIMPAASWLGERHLAALGMDNYWGYNPVALLAPDPRLAPGGWAEIRQAVAALAAAGIETIIDVVLNHSGEGDALGPTVSLRGLDHATYYRLDAGDPRRTVDDTGCGNTLALDRPPVLRLAMDAMRQWAVRSGVHGFRFDLATTLGRRADGFDPTAPLLGAIGQDPVLRGLKLIAEPWDTGPGGYRLGAFPAVWGEWNDRFRDTVRRFWRGDAGVIGDLATRLAGSADVFGPYRRPSRSVNFVTAHDGFSLADLVAYAAKHNAANGEGNHDGTDDNHSWNNGVEGPSGDATVRSARLRDQRALLATLLLARGTPMLSMGAEFGQSQAGNNNAYAQDNGLSWLDWAQADPGLLAFTRALIALRAASPVLREDRFLTGTAAEEGGARDVEWRRPDGSEMRPEDWQDPGAATLIAALSGPGRIVLVLHRGADAIQVLLPEVEAGCVWQTLQGDRAVSPADIQPSSVEVFLEAAAA